MSAVLLGLVLFLPLMARGEVSKSVQPYLISANRLIEDLEYERALEQINRAKKVAQGPEDDVVLSLYEGILLAELGKGQQEASTSAFKAALFLKPDADLPRQVSPKMKKRFEEVRKQIQRELAAKRAKEAPSTPVCLNPPPGCLSPPPGCRLAATACAGEPSFPPSRGACSSWRAVSRGAWHMERSRSCARIPAASSRTRSWRMRPHAGACTRRWAWGCWPRAW
jgi:hypothetical protein